MGNRRWGTDTVVSNRMSVSRRALLCPHSRRMSIWSGTVSFTVAVWITMSACTLGNSLLMLSPFPYLPLSLRLCFLTVTPSHIIPLFPAYRRKREARQAHKLSEFAKRAHGIR